MKHFFSCLAAASAAVLVATGATLVLVGSGTLVFANAGTDSHVNGAETAELNPKAISILPAASTKLAAETSVKAGAAKDPSSTTPLSGEGDETDSSIPKILTQPALTKDNNFSRRNPVIEAVNKTKNAIVMVRVPRPNGAKDMIGTGVIVDQHGFIITNRHVVGDAKNVYVVLADETKIAAEVVVGEARYDLAILRIRTTKKLAILPLAPVEDLMVGETVIAVGHPYGYSHSVSTGIISALNRDITMPTGDVLTALIQTNAAINPGNSGGPLLNVNGEWIGVNVALREGAQNLAFTINAGTVKTFLRQHLNAARVSGIQHGLQCTEKIVGEAGNRQRLVVSFFQGGGNGVIRKGDVLVSIGDMKVYNTFDLERAFWGRKAGDVVQLRIVRQGQEMSISLTVTASAGAGQTAASLPRATVNQSGGTPVAAVATNQR